MIQRQQTLWLILAGVCAFLSFQFPFYTGDIFENAMTIRFVLDAGSRLLLTLLTGVNIVLALVTIFLFKDRKQQLKFAIAGAIVSLLLIVLYFLEVKKFQVGSFSLTAIFVFASLIGYILAIRGIWRDQKLVKSLDKLR